MSNRLSIRHVHLQRASMSGDGMNLEICDGVAGEVLAWFRAETEGEILFEFEDQDRVISMPLRELERAIAAARQDVHSEAYYDEDE